MSAENIDQAKAEFDGLVAQVDPSATGEAGETAGFPSLRYDSLSVPDPQDGESRLTLLFDGDREYVINCQSTPDGREALDAACDQVLETLSGT